MDINEILFIVNENEQMLFDGTSFKSEIPGDIKSYYSASALCSSLVRTHGFKLPKSIPQEKIEVQSEIRMFDEAGLDPDTNFEITSSVIELENSNDNYIEAYATEEATLEKHYGNIAKKNTHIDFIFPSFLSYSAIYAFELLDKKNDLFIYFDDDEAYAVLFKNGEYIASRSISSLQYIAGKLGFSIEDTRKFLTTKGVNSELYTPEEFLYMDKIKEEMRSIVERITHSISHKRNIFGLEYNAIDRIFLDFEGADIPGFLELFSNYGYENVPKEKLELFNSVDVTKKHLALNALYALGMAQNRYKAPNLTIYERKPSFLKTNVGHFSMVLICSVFFASIYPIYATISLNQLEATQSKLQNDLNKMNKATKMLQAKLADARKEKDNLKQEKKDIVKHIVSFSYGFNALEEFDKNTMIRQKMMKDVNIAMKKYKLSSKHLFCDNNHSMSVQIITKNEARDRIAEFMKELLTKGYAHVQTNKVEKNENYYESFVEIRR